MASITYSNFKNGLDTRRSILTTEPGALQDIQDAFINEGASIEKRKAFLNVSYAQSAQIVGPLVVGVTYTITIYNAGDDFTNVGAASNAAWVTFVATGTTPTVYTNSSVLTHETNYGLEVVTNGLLVFGSGTDPGGWTNNVSYQQLVHPAVTDGASYDASKHAMTKVNCSTSFGGNAWVVATFTDGNTFVYWNGVYIPAFRNGQILADGFVAVNLGPGTLLVVGASYYINTYTLGSDFTNVGGTNVAGTTFTATGTTPTTWAFGTILWSLTALQARHNDFIATQLQKQITAADLTGFVIGAVTSNGGSGYEFTINSAPGQTFSLVTTPASTNAGSGTLVNSLISNSIVPVVAVAASATFQLNGGSAVGVAALTAVYVGATDPAGGTNLLSATVGFNGGLVNMAQAIALNINTNNALNGQWSAVATGQQVAIFDNAQQGTAVNGYYLKTVATGDLCVDNIVFNFTSAWATADTVTSILYNDPSKSPFTPTTTINILGATITMGSETVLAFVTRVATQVKTNAGYTAYAVACSTPANSVNLVISRLTIDSGATVGTAGSTLNGVSAAGAVTNGLSGGTSVNNAPITINITPALFSASASGTYAFNSGVVGGVGTITYTWSLQLYTGSGSNVSIITGQGTATISLGVTVPHQSGKLLASGMLTCVAADAVGNQVSQGVSITVYDSII